MPVLASDRAQGPLVSPAKFVFAPPRSRSRCCCAAELLELLAGCDTGTTLAAAACAYSGSAGGTVASVTTAFATTDEFVRRRGVEKEARREKASSRSRELKAEDCDWPW
jgi:hypothetical protein